MTLAEAATNAANVVAPSSGIQFDWTVSAGSVITIFSGIVVWTITLAIAWTKFGGRMDILEFRTDRVETAMNKIAEALGVLSSNDKEVSLLKQQIIAQETQLAALHLTVEQLRRGEGYITGPRRGNLIGEYPPRSDGI